MSQQLRRKLLPIIFNAGETDKMKAPSLGFPLRNKKKERFPRIYFAGSIQKRINFRTLRKNRHEKKIKIQETGDNYMNSCQIEAIGVGSPVVDLVSEVEESLLSRISGKKGGMELVDSLEMVSLLKRIEGVPLKSAGGSAGNTIFALAQMGVPCSFLGKIGKDSDGEYYRKSFEKMGGDCSRFKKDGNKRTACCLSLVTPDSERTMRTDLGAAITFSPEEVSDDDFKGCRHAHIEGYLLFNPELTMAVLKAAKNAGCTISMDLGSFEVVEASEEGLADILHEYVDIVFANEEEAAAFSGSRDPVVGLEALHRHCPTAIVKIGKDGALLTDNGKQIKAPALPVENVRDTTGAGDFWAAGFLYGYLNGYSIRKSGWTGAIFGRHVIQHLGTMLDKKVWGEIAMETTLLLSKEEKSLC